APARLWCLRAGCARAAALLPGHTAAADVAAALSRRPVSAEHLVWGVACRAPARPDPGSRYLRGADDDLRRAVCDLALGGVAVDDFASRPLVPSSAASGPASPSPTPGGSVPNGSQANTPPGEPPPEDGRSSSAPKRRWRSPRVSWPAWTAPAALVSGVVLAAA